MQPSSIFCRAQEARHHALAHAAILDNVRLVANTAAAAWAKEGIAADFRENRRERSLAAAELQIGPSEPPTADLRALSENPDRGHADCS